MNVATLSNKSIKNAFDEEPWSELNSLLYSCWAFFSTGIKPLGELQFESFELRTPHRCGTYDLVTNPDALPLSYKTLVGDKATKLGFCEPRSFLKNPTPFPGLDGVDIKKEHELQISNVDGFVHTTAVVQVVFSKTWR